MSRHSERLFIPTSGGLQLAAILERPLVESKGVILFSHCFTCSKDLKSIVRLSRKLTDFGWLTCRYDFRGIGQSEGVFAETNFHTNLEDLFHMCRGLQAMDLSVDFLFGHSFGGAASALAAPQLLAQGISRIGGVISLAAPSDTAHLADILVRKNPEIEANGVGAVEIGGKSFTITRAMLDDFRKTDFRSQLVASRMNHLVPHLILHSLQDETVSYAHAIQLFEVLRRVSPTQAFADVSLYTLEGSDHLLSREPKDLEIVAQVVDGWCEKRSGFAV